MTHMMNERGKVRQRSASVSSRC